MVVIVQYYEKYHSPQKIGLLIMIFTEVMAQKFPAVGEKIEEREIK